MKILTYRCDTKIDGDWQKGAFCGFPKAREIARENAALGHETRVGAFITHNGQLTFDHWCTVSEFPAQDHQLEDMQVYGCD